MARVFPIVSDSRIFPSGVSGRGGVGSGSAGVSSDALPLVIADATAPAGVDTSNILSSVTQSGDDITITLDANTISNTPATAVHWDFPLIDIYGDAMTDLDLVDIFRSVVRLSSLVPIADLHVGMALVSADERGFAVRLAAVTGDWQVQHASSTAGTWSAWTAATSDTETQGVMGVLSGRGNGALQGRFNGIALDAAGVDQGGATSTATTTASNIGNDFTHARLFVGWIAGAVTTPPVSITLRAGYAAMKVIEFPAFASFFQ